MTKVTITNRGQGSFTMYDESNAPVICPPGQSVTADVPEAVAKILKDEHDKNPKSPIILGDHTENEAVMAGSPPSGNIETTRAEEQNQEEQNQEEQTASRRGRR